MKIFAKCAMGLSWLYYVIWAGQMWLGQFLGWHNDIWRAFDFPRQDHSPPLWTMGVGVVVTIVGLVGLTVVYRGAWRILDGGPQQDFRVLGRNLRGMAVGLLVFWAGYNLLAAGVQYLVILAMPDTAGFTFRWDPLNVEILFLILGVVLLAISGTFERAWQAEDETKHFL